tara:strand:- start:268 stop:447 length:180 start_codon:yes stop_codon:yes gene_type:complete
MNNHISVRLRENLGEKIDEMMAKYDEILGLELSRNYIVNMLLKSGYELEIKRLQGLKSA